MPDFLEPLRSLFVVSRKPVFWVLFGTFFVCGLSTSGLIQTHFISLCGDYGLGALPAASVLATIGAFDFVGTILSGWLSDRFDNRKLLCWYYGLRGLSLLWLPHSEFTWYGLSLFAMFYGLDWVATVPPTVKLANANFDKTRGAMIFGWIFAGHQLGSATAAYGAGLTRTLLLSYGPALYAAGAACLIAAVAIFLIPPIKPSTAVRGRKLFTAHRAASLGVALFLTCSIFRSPEAGAATTSDPPTKAQLVGAWELVSIDWSDAGVSGPDPFYQPDSTGIIIYDSSGWMSVHISGPHRAGWKTPYARRAGTAGQNLGLKAAAFDTYYAYYGTWDYDPMRGAIVHHVRSSVIPDESGRDYSQGVSLDGNRLTFTVIDVYHGRQAVRRKVWRRLSTGDATAAPGSRSSE